MSDSPEQIAVNRRMARIALADLLGTSMPPEGCRDEYPFNAVAHARLLRADLKMGANGTIRYVYKHECLPEELDQ